MNICIRTFFVAVTAVVVCAALPAAGEDAPVKCKLVRVADWHVNLAGGVPVLDGTINGSKVGVLIATGSYATYVTGATAQRLELPTRGTSEVIVSTGGESRISIARIDELKVGEFSAKGLRVRVAGERPMRGIDLVLGHDFLKGFDVEFDYAKGAVRLFQPVDCDGKSLSYWDADALQLPLSGSTKDFIPILVNGRKASAQFASGGSDSIVHLSFASQLGIDPHSPGVDPSRCELGLGSEAVGEWIARFDTVEIGGETIRNPRIRISAYLPDYDYWHGTDSGDMLLAGDFLKAHRVLISHTQSRVYLSYTGGLVFPAVPALSCEGERAAGKSEAEALRIYSDIIAADPKDTDALIRRARILSSRKDAKGALSDLDAALFADPSNAVALSMRARLRAGQKDYDGAIADTDASIAHGMRTADAFVFRASVHRSKGDVEGAIADLDEAVKLDPHHDGALRTRARLLFGIGRYDAAEADFATLLAIRPNGFDSLWLYLLRARRGVDERDVIEQGLKSLKSGEWPEPILQYMAGRIDRDALMASAGADEKKRSARECEAHYYMAERFVTSGKKEEATPLLEAARDGCPRDYVEYQAAIAELGQAR